MNTFAVVVYREGKKEQLSQPMSWYEAYTAWEQENNNSGHRVAIRPLEGRR